MGLTDYVVLYLSSADADALTTSLANQVYEVVAESAEGANCISGSITTAKEAMGRDLLDRALKKFYQRCS